MTFRHLFRSSNPLSLLVICAAALVGCSSSDGPVVAPVTGQISLNGSPFANAGISFRPDASKGNKAEYNPSATSNEDGEYELVTGDKKGAPVGWYKVVVIAPTPPIVGGEAPKVGPPPFDPKYSDVGTTPLSVEVKDQSPPEPYDLEVTK